MNPQIVAAALDDCVLAQYGTPTIATQPLICDDEEDAKTYLILRVMFDLPEDAPRSAWFSFKGWDLPPGLLMGKTVNLAWPVTWNGGRPHLVAGCVGSEGPPYSPGAEYRYMLQRFPLRRLPVDVGPTRGPTSVRHGQA